MTALTAPTALAGIDGTLLPGRFLVDRLAPDAIAAQRDVRIERTRRHLVAWWSGVEADCGPVTGARRLFDRAAVPLVGALGFDVADLAFAPGRAIARLVTPMGASVAFVLLPWSSHASSAWRDPVQAARAWGADWALVFAPPFLSLVDARGHAARRSLDLRLPDIFDPRAFAVVWTLARSESFDRVNGRSHIDAWMEAGTEYQARVRADLQTGVVDALRSLEGASSRSPLTVVFRMLFLLFAESRRLVPVHHPVYAAAYTVTGLCRDAQRPDGVSGLADGLAAITRLSRAGCRTGDLIVSPFNGALFARASAPDLESRTRRSGRAEADRRDRSIGQALVALGTRPGRGGRESIAYADLGVEQLGAVYERLLDLEPGAMAATVRHSARRKATGTFYTPQPLAEFVIRRTLAPLVTGATSASILALRVVDPAMGSGAFLVAACRYLATAYERALVDEGRLSAADLDDDRRAALRRLIAERCLAGVDRNPVAVQLARLSLWLATLAQGKPLSFLDHRLRAGDSLLGASPDDLLRTVAGRRVASMPLLDAAGFEQTLQRIARPLGELTARGDDTVEDARAKQTLWLRLSNDRSPLGVWRRAADAWCARWFLQGAAPPSAPEWRALLDAILRGDGVLPASPRRRWIEAAREASARCRFFHWPLEFADVFYDADGRPHARPGFDAVIGNPPWEMLRRESPSPSADDTRDPGVTRFIRESGLYPHSAGGHLNLYLPFLERSVALTRAGGRVGLVLPWSFASDDGAAGLRRVVFTTTNADTVVGFDNARGLFPIHRGLRFLVLTATPGSTAGTETRARFGVRTGEEIDALPERDDPLEPASAYPVRLTAARLEALSGPTWRIPDARRPADLALLERIAARFPPIGAATGWSARFGRELNATDDRRAFGPRGLPVLEGKHIAPFVAKAAAGGARIPREAAARLLPGRPFDRPRLAYRDVSGVGNRLTLIAAVLPADVVTTHTLFCLRTPLALERSHGLCALFNSYVLNHVARLLMGSHLTTSLVEQLPAPGWDGSARFRRVARLAKWLSRHPAAVRVAAALQADVARLYGLHAGEFDEVLAAFPLVPPAERDTARRMFRELYGAVQA